uniref:Secreted protein n=1 Tax=Anopheles darlingi TaxID=43151 RepID=A0A2M4DFC4_ANODA
MFFSYLKCNSSFALVILLLTTLATTDPSFNSTMEVVEDGAQTPIEVAFVFLGNAGFIPLSGNSTGVNVIDVEDGTNEQIFSVPSLFPDTNPLFGMLSDVVGTTFLGASVVNSKLFGDDTPPRCSLELDSCGTAGDSGSVRAGADDNTPSVTTVTLRSLSFAAAAATATPPATAPVAGASDRSVVMSMVQCSLLVSTTGFPTFVLRPSLLLTLLVAPVLGDVIDSSHPVAVIGAGEELGIALVSIMAIPGLLSAAVPLSTLPLVLLLTLLLLIPALLQTLLLLVLLTLLLVTSATLGGLVVTCPMPGVALLPIVLLVEFAARSRPTVFCCCSRCSLVVTPVVIASTIDCVCCWLDF